MRHTLQSILQTSAVEEVDLISDAVLWYDYEETSGTILYDKTDNNLDGTNDANVTLQYGSEDAAFYTSTGETTINDNNLLTPTGAFSVYAIIRTPASAGWNGYGGKANEYRLAFFNSLQFSFQILNNNTTEGMLVRSSTLSASTVYHILATYDGSGNRSGMKIYVNNVLDVNSTSGLTSATISNTSNNLLVGAYNPGNGLNGVMKQFIMFDVELSEDQRNKLYNSGTKLYWEDA